MPYTPFGSFPNPRDIPRPYQSQRRELVFEEGAHAHSAGFESGVRGWIIRSDGSAEFQGTVLLGASTVLAADIYSDNWDGAIPADLTSLDATATAGYYLDASAGAAQISGNLYVSGDIQMDDDGKFSSAASGSRVEIFGIGAISGYIDFWSDHPDETLASRISTSKGNGQLLLQPASLTGGGLRPAIGMAHGATSWIQFSADRTEVYDGPLIMQGEQLELDETKSVAAPSLTFNSNTTTGMYMISGPIIGFGVGGVKKFEIGGNEITSAVMHEFADGSAAAPGITFENDPDTGFFRDTANAIEGSFAGTKRVKLKAKGLFTDYNNNSLPRVWLTTLTDHTLSAINTWETPTGTFSAAVNTVDAVSIIVTADGYAEQVANTTSRNARCRLQISTDGGSTWTTSNPQRFDDLRSDGNSRMPFSRSFGIENVVPTGNVQARLQVFAGSTDVTFNDMYMVVTIVGDI